MHWTIWMGNFWLTSWARNARSASRYSQFAPHYSWDNIDQTGSTIICSYDLILADNFMQDHHKQYELRHDKTNKMSVRPAKTQISLGIRPVWSESSLCTQWVAKDPRFLHADSEDSDQTGRMPRLIWVFAGRTLILLVLSCRDSYQLKSL